MVAGGKGGDADAEEAEAAAGGKLAAEELFGRGGEVVGAADGGGASGAARECGEIGEAELDGDGPAPVTVLLQAFGDSPAEALGGGEQRAGVVEVSGEGCLGADGLGAGAGSDLAGVFATRLPRQLGATPP